MSYEPLRRRVKPVKGYCFRRTRHPCTNSTKMAIRTSLPRRWVSTSGSAQNPVYSILYVEHYPPSAGHPGAHRMFQTIRRTFVRPHIAEDVYEAVTACRVCARNSIAEKIKTNPLKLCPAKGPLESVAMDILGPLQRTKHGNRFLLVISDRYSKFTKTVPLRTVTSLSVARASVIIGLMFMDVRSPC
jgi:Integrase zinc binding domain